MIQYKLFYLTMKSWTENCAVELLLLLGTRRSRLKRIETADDPLLV